LASEVDTLEQVFVLPHPLEQPPHPRLHADLRLPAQLALRLVSQAISFQVKDLSYQDRQVGALKTHLRRGDTMMLDVGRKMFVMRK
jgi:hypothetical protein